MRWFDAHLDLACLAVNGRDMEAPPERAGGPWQPASVTLPSLAAGGVTHALATIFTEADGQDAAGYPAGDAEAAHRAGAAQLGVYEAWLSRGLACRWRERPARPGALSLGILIEGADPVREPAELAWWAQRGVVAVGLAWWKDSRYAAGNGSTDPSRGLTDLGGRLVDEIDRLGLVHESRSEHPLAEAVVRHLSPHPRPLSGGEGSDPRVDVAFESLTGKGAKATIGGTPWIVGNRRLMEEHGIAITGKWREQEQRWQEGAHTVI